MPNTVIGRTIELLQRSRLLSKSHILRDHIFSKAFENSRRLQDFYYAFRILPNTVAIENTTSCNRKCPYCPHYWQEREPKYMIEALFLKIVDDLSALDYGGTVLFAPFGEPLVDERLETFVRYTRSRLPKGKVVVLTNGDLLTMDRFQELLRAGVHQFLVSDHYRIEGDRYEIDRPECAIETFNRLDKKNKDWMVFLGENYQRIRKIDVFHNRSGLIPLENFHSMKEACGSCSFPEKILTIDYRGRVLLCARQWIKGPEFGNLLKESIGAVWKKPVFRRMRDDLRRGVFEQDICVRCGFGDMPSAEQMGALFKSFQIPVNLTPKA